MKYLSLVVLLMLAGCGTRATNLAGKDFSVRTQPKEIQVFYKDYPARPHEKIALLEKEAIWETTRSGDVIESLKRKASEIGADAIVLENIQDTNFWTVSASKSKAALGNAVAIRWK